MQEIGSGFNEINPHRGNVGSLGRALEDALSRASSFLASPEMNIGKKGPIEVAVAQVHDSGWRGPVEQVESDRLVAFTSGYFRMREEGGFLWESPVIGLDEKRDAFELCFDCIETAKRGQRKNILILSASPDLWYQEYVDGQYLGLQSGYLLTSFIKSLSEKPYAYTPKEYEASLSYRLEAKGRVECLSYEAFRNMEMQGRGEEILDGTEGRPWDIVVMDGKSDAGNPLLSLIKRRFTLYLLPRRDFPEKLPITGKMKEAEDAFSDVQPAEKALQLNVDEKPFSYLSSAPFEDDLSQNSFKDLQSASFLGTQSFDGGMEKTDPKYDAFQEKEYHPYLENLSDPKESKEASFEQSNPLSSTNWSNDRKEERESGHETRQRELEKLAEEHMDFIPETTGNLLQNIDAWLKYWKIDLMLAQNYYGDGVEAKKAKEQIEFLQNALKDMQK